MSVFLQFFPLWNVDNEIQLIFDNQKCLIALLLVRKFVHRTKGSRCKIVNGQIFKKQQIWELSDKMLLFWFTVLNFVTQSEFKQSKNSQKAFSENQSIILFSLHTKKYKDFTPCYIREEKCLTRILYWKIYKRISAFIYLWKEWKIATSLWFTHQSSMCVFYPLFWPLF